MIAVSPQSGVASLIGGARPTLEVQDHGDGNGVAADRPAPSPGRLLEERNRTLSGSGPDGPFAFPLQLTRAVAASPRAVSDTSLPYPLTASVTQRRLTDPP